MLFDYTGGHLKIRLNVNTGTNMAANCIFCKIIKGEIPSMKIFESEKTLAFLDINPLSLGHAVCFTSLLLPPAMT
jgi:diadenosine tetraphosphate (Ap4A) HIT family hydrolase